MKPSKCTNQTLNMLGNQFTHTVGYLANIECWHRTSLKRCLCALLFRITFWPCAPWKTGSHWIKTYKCLNHSLSFSTRKGEREAQPQVLLVSDLSFFHHQKMDFKCLFLSIFRSGCGSGLFHARCKICHLLFFGLLKEKKKFAINVVFVFFTCFFYISR